MRGGVLVAAVAVALAATAGGVAWFVTTSDDDAPVAAATTLTHSDGRATRRRHLRRDQCHARLHTVGHGVITGGRDGHLDRIDGRTAHRRQHRCHGRRQPRRRDDRRRAGLAGSVDLVDQRHRRPPTRDEPGGARLRPRRRHRDRRGVRRCDQGRRQPLEDGARTRRRRQGRTGPGHLRAGRPAGRQCVGRRRWRHQRRRGAPRRSDDGTHRADRGAEQATSSVRSRCLAPP